MNNKPVKEMCVYLLFVALIGCSIATSCPAGWVRHEQTCYHFSHDTETFTGAKAICHDMEGTLLEIDDQQENSYIANQAKLYSTQYRIALTDLVEEGTWIWNESKTPATFFNWGPNEPDSRSNDENCVAMDSTGMWFDIVCHDNRHYVCEMNLEAIGEIVG